MNEAKLNQIAANVYSYVVSNDAPEGYPYTKGTAAGAADFWVESWYAVDDDQRDDDTWYPASEGELLPTAERLIPILVSLGLPQG